MRCFSKELAVRQVRKPFARVVTVEMSSLCLPCDEVSLNRPCPMARKKSAPARPRTGNRRDPLLQQAIIDAATEVLAKEGATRFTIEAVAKMAGCGKPTIYRWWPSRPALLLEV